MFAELWKPTGPFDPKTRVEPLRRASLGKESPYETAETCLKRRTSQCTGTSPNHLTPDGLYAGYGRRPLKVSAGFAIVS